MEDRQGVKLACLEEIAWRNGWIDDAQLLALAEPLLKSGYGEYLRKLLANSGDPGGIGCCDGPQYEDARTLVRSWLLVHRRHSIKNNSHSSRIKTR